MCSSFNYNSSLCLNLGDNPNSGKTIREFNKKTAKKAIKSR